VQTCTFVLHGFLNPFKSHRAVANGLTVIKNASAKSFFICSRS